MQYNLYPELSVLTLYPISVNANPNNPVVISRYITLPLVATLTSSSENADRGRSIIRVMSTPKK
jgi:hypothetical protein